MEMLRIMRKTASTMAKNHGSKSMASISSVGGDSYDVVDDLSAWEFVDPSLSDDDDVQDLCSFTDDDDVTNDDVTSECGKEEEGSESPCDVISMDSLSVSPPPQPQLTLTTVDLFPDGDGEDQEEEVDDDYEDEFGLDDELVPWMLKDRFGRQRIRKLGKRDGSRVYKSKRGPHFFNRPGAVYGKHGLGVQHCFI